MNVARDKGSVMHVQVSVQATTQPLSPTQPSTNNHQLTTINHTTINCHQVITVGFSMPVWV